MKAEVGFDYSGAVKIMSRTRTYTIIASPVGAHKDKLAEGADENDSIEYKITLAEGNPLLYRWEEDEEPKGYGLDDVELYGRSVPGFRGERLKRTACSTPRGPPSATIQDYLLFRSSDCCGARTRTA